MTFLGAIRLHAFRAAFLLLACAVLPAAAQQAPPAGAAPDPIVVQLVTDLKTGELVSDREQIEPVTASTFGEDGGAAVTLGERCELWVRNAHVDKKFFFERYYQGKYIGRRGQIEINRQDLGPGEHTIEPGGHKFTLAEDGSLTSSDPDIRIDGRRVMLRLYRVTVNGVDAAQTGPVDSRRVATELGLFQLPVDLRLDVAALPDPRKTHEPQTDSAGDAAAKPLINLLSQQSEFYPLHIWLPAQQQGQGYVLYPSWQAFHLAPGGKIELAAAGAPAVPGVVAEGTEISIPYREFSGKLSSGGGLKGGVGAAPLKPTMQFGATAAPTRFIAGLEKPDEAFFLPVDTDLSRRPNKWFVADNTTADRQAIRLMALEWDHPVFERGQEVQVSLRLLETPEHTTFAAPQARVSFSPYDPSLPTRRVWQPVEVLGWENGAEVGVLRFRAPDTAFGFGVLRVQIVDQQNSDGVSPLQGEILACLIEPGQQGTAAFATTKGRNVFIAGEEVLAHLILRSRAERPAGRREVVLKHPDGRQETLTFDDSGKTWTAQSLRLPAARTAKLASGKYELRVTQLPAGVVAVPFTFEIVGREKESLYHVVKTSKYTRPMNQLEPSHWQGQPVDLDRAMRTLAELGYNRVDLMTYATSHFKRPHAWRETLASGDDRLPPPAAVYTPTPRDQILNACVREQMEFSGVLLSYNDFHLPRYIDSYIDASRRWLAREVQAMRHSPAFDGVMLYDEMYQAAVNGIVPSHQKYFAQVRARKAADMLGQPPSKIEEAMNRYVARPANQRDPAALAAYVKYQDWQQHGWADYIDRVAAVARELAPAARIGTYHRTWGSPGKNDMLDNGYAPDLFKNLDVISHVHYADNSTCWASIPLLAQALRTGRDKLLYINLPLAHEARTHWDGQYQRQMAFALLAQGANGIAQYSLPTTFEEGANPETARAHETTGPLNRDILLPFGEIVDRTRDGYRKVGIVSTFPQHALSPHKSLDVSHQTEGLWVACWRLGYPAVFLREADCEQPLDEFSVIFVPGVRYEHELPPHVEKQLKAAIAAGVKVVVEQGSELDLPGVVKLDDWPLNDFYTGGYFPTWLDDELNKVYEKSQPIVDYLAPKFIEWKVEPAARGPFKVGPTWRDGGAIDYLIMANFDDPDYRHTVKQQMARPVMMPLTIAAHRGRAAYDLLAQQELPLAAATNGEQSLTLDMRRVQGALTALLPERIAKLEVDSALADDGGSVHLTARLIGASGKPIDGVFPTKITFSGAGEPRTFYRVLGGKLAFTLALPSSASEKTYSLEIRESISGQTVQVEYKSVKPAGASLELLPATQPQIPYPAEITRFLEQNKKVKLVAAAALPGAADVAADLAKQLAARGIECEIVPEDRAFYAPLGNPQAEDPKGDGFHTWRGGQEVIAPGVAIDGPVIILGGRRSSYLIDTLVHHGFLAVEPLGAPNLAVPPMLQVAAKAFHYNYDALCLTANDAAGLQRAATALLEQMPTPAPLPAPHFAAAQTTASRAATPSPRAFDRLGTNEMVLDVKCDKAGNSYAITWGHGKNLYSFDPQGKLRFARHLPEMGAQRLSVHDDRLYVYTAAGARLYRLTLAGEPVNQVRLNMDPGETGGCDNYSLSSANFAYLPKRNVLLHQMGDVMRVLGDQYDLLAEWRGETYVDKDVDDQEQHRELLGYAVSPDGEKLAQLEASYYFTKWGHEDVKVYDLHLVLRDFNGKLLAEAKNLHNVMKNVSAEILWPEGAAGPVIFVGGERRVFDDKLQIAAAQPVQGAGYALGGERRLVRDGRHLLYVDAAGRQVCRLGPLELLPTQTAISPDGALVALLDEQGWLALHRTDTGAQQARWRLPERGGALAFTPDSQHLLIGGYRGRLMSYDLAGKEQWQAVLAEHNDVLGGELPLYDPAFADLTSKLWPTCQDAPAELDTLARLGDNRLQGGDFESPGAWQAEKLNLGEGRQGGRSLRVGDSLVSQEVSQFLGQHVTWVLEFYYRAADPAAAPELLAGLQMQSQYPDSIARRFRASDDWRFARIVAKNGQNCEKILLGFVAEGGEVLVDDVQLRRIRFPSVNHLLFEPLHAVEPVVLENPLFSEKYDPFGTLRDEAPNRVLVENIRTGAMNLVESAFLQNGRTNEIGSQWYIQPLGHDPTVSLGLREPQWVSMVALYFNVHDEANVTPHFDVFVTDMETQDERLVASVRHNGQLFRLVKFPPVKTPLVKVKFVNSIARLRTVTEIELYGPLSGREGTPGFVDPAGQNTYMGDFSRVDKRDKPLAAEYLPPASHNGGYSEEINWYAPLTQILASEDRFYVGRTLGKNEAYRFSEPLKSQYLERAGGLGYTPYGLLYGGLLVRPGNDGKLYCINPDTGRELWSVKLGDRLYGCPVAIGEDLYVASDRKILYQIDFASGSVMREAPLSGVVFGGLATDGALLVMITDDGFVQAYRAADLTPVWKSPIAPYTDSTPALDGGLVYLADQKGTAMALELSSGKLRWQSDLGDEFARCPVVGKDKIAYGCRGGTLVVLERGDGKRVWSKNVESRFHYEPLLTGDKLLFFRRGAAMLADLKDGAETPLLAAKAQNPPPKPGEPLPLEPYAPGEPTASLGYYQGNLMVVPRTDHSGFHVVYPWSVAGGKFNVLRPVPPPAAPAPSEAK